MVELGNATEIRGGATPRRDDAAFWSGDIPRVTPTDLPAPGAGITDVDDTADCITDAGLASCPARILPPSTANVFLLSKYRENRNPEHKPICADLRSDDVAIVGIVVGAIIGTRRASE